MEAGRYVGHVLAQIRKDTDNEDYSATNGIEQQTLIEHLNDAQAMLQAMISATYSEAFRRYQEISLSANEDTYSVNDNILIGNRILNVEYTPTGDARDYRALPVKTIKDRISDTSPDPSFYIPTHNGIIVCPKPSQAIGKLRVTYEYSVYPLSLRLAKVSSTSGTPITSLSYTEGETRITELVAGDYISIVDKFGNVLASAIPVTAGGVDSGTSTIAIDSHTLATGESIPANSYVVEGKYATTHSMFPRSVENALRKYVESMVLDIDESEKAAKKYTASQRLMQEFADQYADANADTYSIRIEDEESFI